MPGIAQDGEEEYSVKMMPGEDEDGNTLEEVHFGNGKRRSLEPPCNFAGTWGQCKSPGVIT